MDKQNATYLNNEIYSHIKTNDILMPACGWTWTTWCQVKRASHVLYDPTCVKFLKQANLLRQKVDWGGVGWRRGGKQEELVTGMGLLLGEWKALKSDGGDGWTTLRLYPKHRITQFKWVNCVVSKGCFHKARVCRRRGHRVMETGPAGPRLSPTAAAPH